MISLDKTYVFFAKTISFNSAKYLKYYDLLPESRKKHIEMIEKDDDKKRSVSAYILLLNSCKSLGIDISKYTFNQNEQDKPFFENCPIKFCISHSGNYVSVAISSEDVGIDIQKIIDTVNASFASIVLSKDELTKYSSLSGKRKLLYFYKLWCMKESYSKMSGNMLSISMKDLSGENPSNDCKIAFYNFKKQYFISCSYKTKNISKFKQIAL